jgi:uncharacterized integral membrane protein (TIGR00698 family)
MSLPEKTAPKPQNESSPHNAPPQAGDSRQLAGLIATVAICAGIALVADLLGGLLPLIGGPIFAILLGVTIVNLRGGLPDFAALRIGKVSGYGLKGGIVLIGASLNLVYVVSAGQTSLVVMIFTTAAGILIAQLIGARLGIGWRMRWLVGVGTIICGASAIAAVAPVLRAKTEEVAYSISVIFLFNMLAVIIFPMIGHLFGFSDTAFGMWAGTAINDTSAVVAAGYGFSHAAGDYATIVKLTRTTLIIPITVALALLVPYLERRAAEADATAETGPRERKASLASIGKTVPWFILFFVLASLLNTLGLFGGLAPQIQWAGRFVLLIALAAVGLQGHWRVYVAAGLRPLLLGMSAWAAVALTSIVIQAWMGQF